MEHVLSFVVILFYRIQQKKNKRKSFRKSFATFRNAMGKINCSFVHTYHVILSDPEQSEGESKNPFSYKKDADPSTSLRKFL